VNKALQNAFYVSHVPQVISSKLSGIFIMDGEKRWFRIDIIAGSTFTKPQKKWENPSCG
jgi:hypothetical protein